MDPIRIAIKKHSKHPNILKIKAPSNTTGDKFSFCHTALDNIYNEIVQDSNPSKIIKDNYDIFGENLLTDFNLSVDYGLFPSNLKYADVTPVYKKGERADKSNYRPVSLIPALSKKFEINDIESKLSKFQCGFRKSISAQHCLIVMIERWKLSFDNKCLLEYSSQTCLRLLIV